jgi:predicted helicase
MESGGDIKTVYDGFKEVLLPHLTPEEFADMYAQTISYGLFAARCAPSSAREFTRQEAADLVPRTNPFLRRLFQRIAAFDLDPRVAWIADDAARLLGKAPVEEILGNFLRRTGRQDPVVHFYETFLAAYDPALRELRGVYYTPEPVVSYITRSIDNLLKTRFDKPTGLADDNTLILDPAAGTASFLFAVTNLVHEAVRTGIGEGTWNDYVEKKLLPRLFGFELLVAPYAIAHLKLGLLLQEYGYKFQSDQRLSIYLTNTLEEAIRKSELLFGKYVSDEANEAVEIKRDRPILVVFGNPPYSGHSANRSRDAGGKLTFIGHLIEDYKLVDGKPLGERNPKWLQDDYVKFIRFAEWRIDRTKEGVLGYITNHSYLDNPTFRGMRQHLMRTFNEIYVLDLHGNSKKKEKAPDGSKDENVFDIQQGVAIILGVKRAGDSSPARVYHADLWGTREKKYEYLSQTDLSTTEWRELRAEAPLYLFQPQDLALRAEYEQGWKLTDAMPVNVLGFQSHRDNFAIAFDQAAIHERIRDLRDPALTDDAIRQKYNLKDSGSWKLAEARTASRAADDWEKPVHQCLYRPFDRRCCYLSTVAIDRPRRELLAHVAGRLNLCLNAVRQTKADNWRHAVVSDCPAPAVFVEVKDGSNIFPLFLYPSGGEGQNSFGGGRHPNLSPAFRKALSEKLHLPQVGPDGMPQGITPEDIFHYAYAVFHSPTYGERYAEFLKRDFPRLPLTSDLALFRDLAEFGRQLVALHLLDSQVAGVLNKPISPFAVAGSNVVEQVRYAEKQRRVYVNREQYFDNVPKEAWGFYVGGYQVCEKWLKDRKGRKLTVDDIQHYQRIVIALLETARIMQAIDARIPGFPIV